MKPRGGQWCGIGVWGWMCKWVVVAVELSDGKVGLAVGPKDEWCLLWCGVGSFVCEVCGFLGLVVPSGVCDGYKLLSVGAAS